MSLPNKIKNFLWKICVDASTSPCQKFKNKRQATTKQTNRNNACWIPPPVNTFKLNFDGSKYDSNSTAIGFIIINHKGELILSAAKQIYSNANILFTEALALREGIKQAISLGISHLIIESDNLAFINTLRNIWHIPWEIHNLIQDSKKDLNALECVVVNHSYREANKAADYIANLGHHFSSMTCWMLPYDSSLSLIISKDALGWPPQRGVNRFSFPYKEKHLLFTRIIVFKEHVITSIIKIEVSISILRILYGV